MLKAGQLDEEQGKHKQVSANEMLWFCCQVADEVDEAEEVM